MRSRSVKTCTAWQKPTRRSHTSDSKFAEFSNEVSTWLAKPRLTAIAISVFAHTLMPARPLRQSAFFFTPAFRTKWAKYTTALQPWIGWSRSKSAASPLPQQQRPVSGVVCKTSSMNTVLISSIPPVTLILQLKLSALCGCSTVPLLCSVAPQGFSHKLKRSGARPTSTRCLAWCSSTRWIGPAQIL